MLSCNRENRPEEEAKPSPLTAGLAEADVGFVALCLRKRAARTFPRFRAIYHSERPGLLFNVVKESPQEGTTIDARFAIIGRSLGNAPDLIRDP
jgi:hypothetical protein